MTSMKRIFVVVLMVLMMAAAAFAEAHKKQKVVTLTTSIAALTRLEMQGDKGTFREPKLLHGVIPDGWHVVSMWVEVVSPAQTIIYFVLEEN